MNKTGSSRRQFVAGAAIAAATTGNMSARAQEASKSPGAPTTYANAVTDNTVKANLKTVRKSKVLSTGDDTLDAELLALASN